MKFLSLVYLSFFLCGCVTTSAERLQQSEDYERRADAANKQAESHGQLAGTPENIAGINKANEQAVSFRKSANDAKYNDTWLDILLSIFND
ncbi:hypothetical protein [Oceanicoccus sp. KOV_DT_Chl]|uniref:hypothetical protein n=1 Tax=Oceanicoccus sp. KOV_DT_Chl TaxID=1904639 RepID=UPI000C7BE577|nr:hypothetical protein [Oceanicoccus sp. KOV_DT_Chl]